MRNGRKVMLSYTTLQNLISVARMVIDIAIITLLLYYCLKLVRNNSRTIQIFKGVLFVLLLKGVATFFGLKTVTVVANILVQWGFLAIIIIFQPEIRSLLERLGKSSFFNRISSLSGNEREELVDQLVEASMTMASQRVGALITIEQSQSLSDYIRTGTPMNSIVTSDLLCSIFMTTTPLHDGAVIIQGDRIACASAYFLPTDRNLARRYGARHRAAVGISEITDSITIVVSEETGNVSIAQNGELTRMSNETLRQFLRMIICKEEVEHSDRGLVSKDISKKEEDEIYREIIQEEALAAEEKLKLENRENTEEEKQENSSFFSRFRKKKDEKPEEKPEEEENKEIELEFSADKNSDLSRLDLSGQNEEEKEEKDHE